MRPLTLLLLASLLLQLACDGATRDRRRARGEFFVSDPDHIYFMNTRTRDYADRPLEDGLTLYLHEEQTALGAPVQFAIRDNWFDDEAYLEVRYVGVSQGNETVGPDFGLQVREGESWAPVPVRTVAHLTALRRMIASNRELRVYNYGETREALPEGKARGVALEVLDDYLRLVGD